MTKECKTSEKQSALIHPNKSFYAPPRLLVAAFRWKPDAYSVVAFAVGCETLYDHSGSRGSGGSSFTSCSGTMNIISF